MDKTFEGITKQLARLHKNIERITAANDENERIVQTLKESDDRVRNRSRQEPVLMNSVQSS